METATALTVTPIAAALALFLDTETTGLPLWKEPSEHPDQPHMVQLAAKLVNLNTREVVRSMDVLIKPDGWTIPEDTIAVHGITNERAAAEGIPEVDAVHQLLAMAEELDVDGEVIGHNISFDKRIVRIAIKRHIDAQLPEGADSHADAWKDRKDFCTMWKSKPHTRLPGNKHPKLTEAYQHFMGKPMEGAHSAGGDVDGCIAVYFGIRDAEAPVLKAA